MVVKILLICIISFEYVYNDDGGCGCSVDREHAKGIQSKYLEGVQQTEADQCPFDKSNTLASGAAEGITVDMVTVPAGDYQLGTDDIMIETDSEGPLRTVKLETFLIDRFEVSNRDFMKFVSSTNYKTEAETFGDSFVFTLFLNATYREELKDFRVVQAPWWYKVDGANWRHPYGRDSNISDSMDHPVIHVSWRDARAYCKWRDARLPTEPEWEAACRGGKHRTKYPWGDKLFPDRKHMYDAFIHK
ncbi:formylglycine-generating enzyme [Choristoneura fumiferana]|uniref:formylglycine-generating enzyme n=1 Tax=Choristoneura fumiferana TaxID=7141 RepID=UPI003D15CE3E